MGDMKIVKYLKESILLLKGLSKSIKKETKSKRANIIMSLGKLDAILFQ